MTAVTAEDLGLALREVTICCDIPVGARMMNCEEARALRWYMDYLAELASPRKPPQRARAFGVEEGRTGT